MSSKSAQQLFHEVSRGGHVECVQELLDRGVDIEVRVNGLTALDVARQAGHAAVVRLLKEEEHRHSNDQAKALLARQAEARGRAEQAELAMRAGEELGALAMEAAQRASATAKQPSSSAGGNLFSAASSRAAASKHASNKQAANRRDRLRELSCVYVEHHGLVHRSAPAELRAWLGTQSARDLFADLAEALPGREAPPDADASPTEVALSVRVAQLRLREAASAALGRILGQDDLMPLLEQLIITARPCAAFSAQQRMEQIADDELLRKPDLASAVDGWIQACSGIEHVALSEWRRALCDATFWRALSRSPPPNALMMAVCEQKRGEPLEDVFSSFRSHLGAEEEEAWLHARSPAAHRDALRRSVEEMLPIGDVIHVAYSV